MKRYLLTASVFVVLFSGCLKDTIKESYTFYRPVYRTSAEVKSNIKIAAPTPVAQPGKIVAKDHYLFVNEVDKGIHIINIADPSKPINTAFIAIPGNIDLAINGNYLYADCYTDLVTIDITDPANISVKQFAEGVFPRRYYGTSFADPTKVFFPDTTKVIQEWVRVDTVVDKRFSLSFKDLVPQNYLVYLSSSSFSTASGYTTGGMAIAGSLARFGLFSNRLYTVSNDDLKVFNVSNAAAPSFVTKVDMTEGNIETIFPYKSNLFIGSMNGMFVYDASNPDAPKRFSKFLHARSCDPVIADDNFAYVTLWGGAACGGFSNQVDVIAINNLASPTLYKSYNLTGPKGLSKDGKLLFICDKDGLKLFNVANTGDLVQLQHITGFEPNDVIAINGIASVTAKDGIYLVDYAVPGNAAVVSKITITQK